MPRWFMVACGAEAVRGGFTWSGVDPVRAGGRSEEEAGDKHHVREVWERK
jgi:hypothetical protein